MLTNLAGGTYTVRVTDANGCTASSTSAITMTKTTADYSFIGSNFNSTLIPTNNYIWFSCRAKVNYTGTYPVTIQFTDQNINSTRFNLLPVKGRLVITNAVTQATTTFNGTEWYTVAPPDPNGVYFISGMIYKTTSPIAGNLNPIKWKGIWTASSTCVTSVEWNWSAAVYSSFALIPSYVEIKPIDAATGSLYNNTDAAGTPENYRAFLIAGARGLGGTNYTGTPTVTGIRTPCAIPDVCVTPFSFKLNQDVESDEDIFKEEINGEPNFLVNAYPNPFSGTATIVFERTDKSDRAVVDVYTITGKLVRRLFDAQIEQAVEYRVQFIADDLPDGIYMYKITTGDQVYDGKLILQK
jgi:hypothetical protein